jgi:hypothetical protein
MVSSYGGWLCLTSSVIRENTPETGGHFFSICSNRSRLLSGMPLFLLAKEKEKHWVIVATDDDYAVLKIENDNYRLIRMEFIVKKVGIVDIDESQ